MKTLNSNQRTDAQPATNVPASVHEDIKAALDDPMDVVIVRPDGEACSLTELPEDALIENPNGGYITSSWLKARITRLREVHQKWATAEFAKAQAEGRAGTIEDLFNILMPEIELKAGELDRIIGQMASALTNSGIGYFRRGPQLVKAIAVREPLTAHKVERKEGSLMFRVADASMLRRDMSRCSRLVRFVEKKDLTGTTTLVKVPADLPRETALALLAAVPDLIEVPIVRGITASPIIHEDGSLILRPGYDPRSRLIFDATGFDVATLMVPGKPTSKDVHEALATIKEPFAEFDYVGETDRAVALSAVLSAVLRPSLDTCPLHGFSSPSFGAGKSKQCEIASIIATNARMTVAQPGFSQEEFEKRIDAVNLSGDPIVCIDNVSIPLGGDNICSSLTSTSVKVRPFGRNNIQLVVPSTTFWMANGANLSMRGDMVRRSVMARIDPNCENPERRPFRIKNLEDWTLRNRARLLSAVLTLLRAHAQAGYPCHGDSLGSFEMWSRGVRACLIWLEIGDPVESQKTIASEDPLSTTRGEIFSAIYAVRGNQLWTANDLAQIVARVSSRDYSVTPAELALAEALALTGKNGKFDPRALTYWLRSANGVVVGGLKLIRSEDAGRNAKFYVSPVGPPMAQLTASDEVGF